MAYDNDKYSGPRGRGKAMKRPPKPTEAPPPGYKYVYQEGKWQAIKAKSKPEYTKVPEKPDYSAGEGKEWRYNTATKKWQALRKPTTGMKNVLEGKTWKTVRVE